MRRILVLQLGTARCLSTWDDGSEGYEWKSRALAEKRSLALEYLGNVSKRVQIHDSIRLKANVNREAIKNSTIPSFLGGDDKSYDDSEEIDYHSLLQMVEGANDTDTLAYLSSSDASLLKDEFLQSDHAEEVKLLNQWVGLRRDVADYQNYAAKPDGERNAWSAWYLRNVRASKPHED
ncbi:hypothetical protein DQ04_01521010 [Trypanosoma grayi]|uniref:hypothetical protein n=1 Tax=Trypanosoma grayi TaxID=71804 RepID=UPI0004F480F5|nr:hypothetical protein DQ04_01521010 [Trypanosoma grayi]KEG12674.1 hypothetical protein DQ04_01521010 [Trypanosoma grayi]